MDIRCEVCGGPGYMLISDGGVKYLVCSIQCASQVMDVYQYIQGKAPTDNVEDPFE